MNLMGFNMKEFKKVKHSGKNKNLKDSQKERFYNDKSEAKDYGYYKDIKNTNTRGFK
jgi:hypothetical protein